MAASEGCVRRRGRIEGRIEACVRVEGCIDGRIEAARPVEGCIEPGVRIKGRIERYIEGRIEGCVRVEGCIEGCVASRAAASSRASARGPHRGVRQHRGLASRRAPHRALHRVFRRRVGGLRPHRPRLHPIGRRYARRLSRRRRRSKRRSDRRYTTKSLSAAMERQQCGERNQGDSRRVSKPSNHDPPIPLPDRRNARSDAVKQFSSRRQSGGNAELLGEAPWRERANVTVLRVAEGGRRGHRCGVIQVEDERQGR